jgi:hypothetical protein
MSEEFEVEVPDVGDADIGLSDDEVSKYTTRSSWFKGEKDHRYRVALLYFSPLKVAVTRALRLKKPDITEAELKAGILKALTRRAEERNKPVAQLQPHEVLDTSQVRFVPTTAYYKEGVGYVMRTGKEGPEADKIWEKMGDSKVYFTTVLVVYPTDRQGNLMKDRVQKDWYVVPWRPSSAVYQRLNELQKSLKENDLSLATQDLMLVCTNSGYQNFNVDPAGKAFWTARDESGKLRWPDLHYEILEKAYAFYGKKLVPFRTMTTLELSEKLGLDASSSVAADTGSDDFSDLIDAV